MKDSFEANLGGCPIDELLCAVEIAEDVWGSKKGKATLNGSDVQLLLLAEYSVIVGVKAVSELEAWWS